MEEVVIIFAINMQQNCYCDELQKCAYYWSHSNYVICIMEGIMETCCKFTNLIYIREPTLEQLKKGFPSVEKINQKTLEFSLDEERHCTSLIFYNDELHSDSAPEILEEFPSISPYLSRAALSQAALPLDLNKEDPGQDQIFRELY